MRLGILSAGTKRAGAARRWLQARQADLLPVEYYHVVFTLPAPISAFVTGSVFGLPVAPGDLKHADRWRLAHSPAASAWRQGRCAVALDFPVTDRFEKATALESADQDDVALRR